MITATSVFIAFCLGFFVAGLMAESIFRRHAGDKERKES